MLRAWLRVASRAVVLQVEQSQRLAGPPFNAGQASLTAPRRSTTPAAPSSQSDLRESVTKARPLPSIAEEPAAVHAARDTPPTLQVRAPAKLKADDAHPDVTPPQAEKSIEGSAAYPDLLNSAIPPAPAPSPAVLPASAPSTHVSASDPTPAPVKIFPSSSATAIADSTDAQPSRAPSTSQANVPEQRTTPASTIEAEDLPTLDSPPAVTLRPSKVPSSRIGRLLHYGSLFAGMSVGAAGEYVKRQAGGGGSGSAFLSESNIRRLVDKLSRMRGAALKLGQFMSIQDTHTLPPQLESVLQQVQAQADYMPWWQLDEVMSGELGGSDWVERFDEFAKVPIASASIGQVHRAKVNGENVAVKVQFPGIHRSIVSDLDNLSILLRTSALLPRGLYLDNTLKVMREELADECDYEKEADSGRRMAAFLANDTFFEVPRVFDDLSSTRVLTTQWMSGRPLSQIKDLSQANRDKLGTNVLRLCLLELFQFRLMQTDPNWANFLYDRQRDKLQLIDFGATREYTPEFMDEWYGLLKSVVDGDRDAMARHSRQVGYLTGEESPEMLEAHLRSMELLGTPFTQEVYDFGKQSVTDEVRQLIPIMLRHRLTPPPNETYSLNRKLSGSFLLCAKLGSRVRCRDLWEDIVGNYRPLR